MGMDAFSATPVRSRNIALWCGLVAALFVGIAVIVPYAMPRMRVVSQQEQSAEDADDAMDDLAQSLDATAGRRAQRAIHTNAAATTPLKWSRNNASTGGASASTPSASSSGGWWWRDVPRNASRPMRVVFLGDSVTRYQYLDLVYRLHHADDGANGTPPPGLLHNRRNASWMSFFRASTEVFNGSMACDCARQPYSVKLDLSTTVENRFYHHPRYPLSVAYLQLFGSKPMSSRVPLGNTTGAVPRLIVRRSSGGGGVPPTNASWYYYRKPLKWVVENKLVDLAPTHIVINIGLWGHKKLIYDIHNILRAMRRIARHVVWRATSQPSPTCTLLRAKRAQAAWLHMQHKIQTLDVVVQQGGLCRATTAAAGGGAPPNASRAFQDVCYYLPLTEESRGVATRRRVVPESEFVDEVHPAPYVYGVWNAKLWPFLRRLHEESPAAM